MLDCVWILKRMMPRFNIWARLDRDSGNILYYESFWHEVNPNTLKPMVF